MNTTITSLNDLRHYGINMLTGESCALSRRLLCDVTQKGKDLIMKALGVHDMSLAPDWNGHDAVGSILLDRETLETCAILALLDEPEVKEVWVNEVGHIHGLDRELLNSYVKNKAYLDTDKWRKYRKFERSVGGRNIHQMSGRTM